MADNSLTSLPSTLSRLSRLKELNIYRNKFRSLEGKIFRHLVNLEVLDVAGNHLSVLPPEIALLKKLKKFHRQSNPWLNPKETLQSDIPTLLDALGGGPARRAKQSEIVQRRRRLVAFACSVAAFAMGVNFLVRALGRGRNDPGNTEKRRGSAT